MENPSGWLLVYVITSVPVLLFYAAGLSGWVLNYPRWLFVAIFLVLAVPLALIVVEAPSAPEWNIAGLWIGAGLISLRVVTGIAASDAPSFSRSEVVILTAVVGSAIAWAAAWTAYFLASTTVADTFR